MQLEVKPYELPQALSFNYDELKTALTEKVRFYETVVYGDDQIKQAKSDRADLNRLKKALDEERKRREKEYMVPFNEFKDKINEIIAIIDKPVSIIDAQVKEYEQKKKDEKRELIKAEFERFGFPEYITLEKVWDDSWLNTTCSMARIKEEFKTIAYRDEQAMQMFENLPEYNFEAAEYYKQNLDITAAVAKAHEMARIAKAKKAAEEEAARSAAITEQVKPEEIPMNDPEPAEADEEPAEIERCWVKFEAFLSVEEAKELNAFFKYNKIAFRPIK